MLATDTRPLALAELRAIRDALEGPESAVMEHVTPAIFIKDGVLLYRQHESQEERHYEAGHGHLDWIIEQSCPHGCSVRAVAAQQAFTLGNTIDNECQGGLVDRFYEWAEESLASFRPALAAAERLSRACLEVGRQGLVRWLR
jgi:hypothetical protein